MMTTETSTTAAPPVSKKRLKSLGASAMGNLLEWFDWTLFAVFSPYIAQAMFDQTDPASALLATLAVFAVGFLFRPLGGVIFGRMADKLGRRKTMITTMMLMAAGSLMIAVLPGYATIGVAASVLLLVARLLQGLAHGGEAITSYAYVSEIAPKEHRGLWSSSVFTCVAAGSLLATLLGSFLVSTLTVQAVEDWAWRIPFFLGASLALVALYLRRGMMESEVHEEAVVERDELTEQESRDRQSHMQPLSRARITIIGLKMFLYQSGASVIFYTWTSFAAVFAITQRDMNPASAFLASVFAQLLYIMLIPVGGWLSDRIGRKPVLIICFGGFILLTIPLMNLISDAPWTLFVAQGCALALVSLVAGPNPAVMSEQVPTRYRTRTMGLCISLAAAVFGGTAPYLNTWLSGSGVGWVFSLYTIATCAISLIVVLTWKETKGIDLRDI